MSDYPNQISMGDRYARAHRSWPMLDTEGRHGELMGQERLGGGMIVTGRRYGANRQLMGRTFGD